MSLISNDLFSAQTPWPIASKSPFAAQAIEIRGFRLTQAFPLAYDGSRTNKAESTFFSSYAISDLASGTVLGRGTLASRGRSYAARISDSSHAPVRCAR